MADVEEGETVRMDCYLDGAVAAAALGTQFYDSFGSCEAPDAVTKLGW